MDEPDSPSLNRSSSNLLQRRMSRRNSSMRAVTNSDPLDLTAALRTFEVNSPKFTRFWVLCVFTLLSVVQGLAWLTFAPITQEVKDYYSPVMNDSQLELLDAWGPIVYLPGAFVVMWALTRPRGFRQVVLVAATLSAVGSVLRVLAATNLQGSSVQVKVWLLHIAQMCNAAVGPAVVGCPSLLSALWFPADQTASATAVAVLSNNLGNAVAYVAGPYLVPRIGMKNYFLAQLGLALLALLSAVVYFPHGPTIPCSATSASLRCGAASWADLEEDDNENSNSNSGNINNNDYLASSPSAKGIAKGKEALGHFTVLLEEVLEYIRKPTALLLAIVYAWSSGGFVAWTSMLGLTLSQSEDPKLSNNLFVAWMTFLATMTYIAGGVVTSYITETYFAKRMKAVLLISAVLSTASAVLFLLATPTPWNARPLLETHEVTMMIIVGACGVFNGSAAPIFYELAAEVSFPVSEGTSGNVLSFFENIGALLLYVLMMNAFDANAMNVVFTVGMGVCTLLVLLCHEEYRRQEMEIETQPMAATVATESNVAANLHNFQVALGTSPRDPFPAWGGGGEKAPLIGGGGTAGGNTTTAATMASRSAKRAETTLSKKQQHPSTDRLET